MARPRSVLQVDGGTAPPAPDPDAPPAEQQPDEPAAPAVALAGEEAPVEWTSETLRTIVALPFMAAHLFARRRGPEDAWMPDDSELDLMVAPLLNMANRHAMLRALARVGDPVAFTAAVGTYTVAESRRIAAYRLAYAETAPLPDEELAGLHVAAETPAASPSPRPWRPPSVES